MATSLEELVRDVLGNQLVEILKLQARNALLQEQLAEALAKIPPPPDTPSGDAV